MGKVSPRNPNDRVTVAPEVLLTVARYATLRVEGVARMSSIPGGVDRLWRRTPSAEGVQILVDGQAATIDLFVVVKARYNMREVSHAVQREVARAIRQTIGMEIRAVNVHIDDVVFDPPAEA
ncbi:MAG: Asp23/Gls24 family envelope stress response protein [Anaerolineae bacterium]|nr:Asp23/Gls24 family envelope stress response protein [Anaerolineae bacterium]